MNFKQYLEKYKDIINEPLKDFQIDHLNLDWNTPDEFIYSKLLKIILTCINKFPLRMHIERNEQGLSDVAFGTTSQFSIISTRIKYDSIDINKLKNDNEYTALFIMQCLAPFGDLNNLKCLDDFSTKQLAKFLDMTEIILR